MRVALVGLGNAGENIHLPALQGMSSAQVVGACDLDERRRSSVSRRYSVPVFDDYDRMLGEVNPEVVIVGTPPQTHGKFCLKAISAGAHVLCEKPFVSSLAEADEIIAAAAKSGRQVALNHEFREMAIFRALRDEVDRGGVGELAFVQVWQLMDLPPWKESGWRGQMLQRTLYEAGVHLVDLVIALFGEKPVAVSATISTCGVHEGKSDAVAVVILEFSRGRLATIIQNRLCKGETQYFEVRVDGVEASLRASFGGRARMSAGLYRSRRPHLRIEFGLAGIAWREVGNDRTFLARNPMRPEIEATRAVFTKSFQAFRDGTQPPTSAQEGRDVLEVIAACYHAAQSGRRIEMQSEEVRALRDLDMAMGLNAE